jgi:hypothetical protein
VPEAFEMIAQKKYVTPELKPVAVIEYGIEAPPEPRSVPLIAGTRVPKVSLHVPGFVALIRNQPVVSSPLGLPVPLSDAELVVIIVAAVVVATGAAANALKDEKNTRTKKNARRTCRYITTPENRSGTDRNGGTVNDSLAQ